MKRSQAAGFGLLEAIVSLTLLAGTGMALFGWIQQNLQSASRLQTAREAAQLQMNAQAFVDALNPSDRPSGQESLAALDVTWKATLVEKQRPNAALTPGATGNWTLGLYRIDIQARDTKTGLSRDLVAYRVGYRPGTAAAAPGDTEPRP